jgi:hypothetical protein
MKTVVIRLEPDLGDAPPPRHCVLCGREFLTNGTVPVVYEAGQQIGLACYQCAASRGTTGVDRLRRGGGG